LDANVELFCALIIEVVHSFDLVVDEGNLLHLTFFGHDVVSRAVDSKVYIGSISCHGNGVSEVAKLSLGLSATDNGELE
jgi:hypothetical protein